MNLISKLNIIFENCVKTNVESINWINFVNYRYFLQLFTLIIHGMNIFSLKK